MPHLFDLWGESREKVKWRHAQSFDKFENIDPEICTEVSRGGSRDTDEKS